MNPFPACLDTKIRAITKGAIMTFVTALILTWGADLHAQKTDLPPRQQAGMTDQDAKTQKTHNNNANGTHETLAPPDSSNHADLPADAAAIVNGVPISKDSLNEAIKFMTQKLDNDEILESFENVMSGNNTGCNATSCPEELLHDIALQRLIDEELAVQEAKKEGINIPPGTIRKITSKLRYQMQAENSPTYETSLNQSGLKKMIIRDYLFKQICTKNILPLIKVSPEAVQSIYKDKSQQFIIPEKIIITDIHFFREKNSKKLMAEANKALKYIFSNKNSDIKNLDLPASPAVRTFELSEKIYPELYFVAWDMEAGEISEPVTTRDGIHIIKIEKKDPERKMTLEEARPFIERHLIIKQYRKHYARFFNGLRQKAEIIIPTIP